MPPPVGALRLPDAGVGALGGPVCLKHVPYDGGHLLSVVNQARRLRCGVSGGVSGCVSGGVGGGVSGDGRAGLTTLVTNYNFSRIGSSWMKRKIFLIFLLNLDS